MKKPEREIRSQIICFDGYNATLEIDYYDAWLLRELLNGEKRFTHDDLQRLLELKVLLCEIIDHA